VNINASFAGLRESEDRHSGTIRVESDEHKEADMIVSDTIRFIQFLTDSTCSFSVALRHIQVHHDRMIHSFIGHIVCQTIDVHEATLIICGFHYMSAERRWSRESAFLVIVH
jgi:hypothetical protein